MKLGFLSAILDGWTYEEMMDVAHDMGFQQLFQSQEPFPFPRGQTPHGDAGAGRNHPGDIGGSHRPRPAVFPRLGHHGLHFVPQLRRLFKSPLPHCLVELLFQFLSGRAAPG